MKVVSIEWLRERARNRLPVSPAPIESTDRVIAVVRYRDGSESDRCGASGEGISHAPASGTRRLCHDVSYSRELLASRDERQQDSVSRQRATPPTGLLLPWWRQPDERQRVNLPDLNHGVTALHTLAEEYGFRPSGEQAAFGFRQRAGRGCW